MSTSNIVYNNHQWVTIFNTQTTITNTYTQINYNKTINPSEYSFISLLLSKSGVMTQLVLSHRIDEFGGGYIKLGDYSGFIDISNTSSSGFKIKSNLSDLILYRVYAM